MTKVDINSTYHQVTIEGEGTIDQLAELAMKVYDKTWRPLEPIRSGGTGFTTERREVQNLYKMDADGK